MLHIGTNTGFHMSPNSGIGSYRMIAKSCVVAPVLRPRKQGSPQYLDPQQYHLMTLPLALQGPPTVSGCVPTEKRPPTMPLVEDPEEGTVATAAPRNFCGELQTVEPVANKPSDVNPDPLPISRLRQEDVNMRPTRVNGDQVVLSKPSYTTGNRLLSNPGIMSTQTSLNAALRPFVNKQEVIVAAGAAAFPGTVDADVYQPSAYTSQSVGQIKGCQPTAHSLVRPFLTNPGAIVAPSQCGNPIPFRSRIDNSISSTYGVLRGTK